MPVPISAAFRAAINLPPSGQYRYDYALALVRADRFEDARIEAELAVRADPKLAEPHELLGGIHVRKNNLPEAAREYQAALSLQDSARVHLRLGTVLSAQGKKDEAAIHLRAAANSSDPNISKQALRASKSSVVAVD